MKVNRCNKEVFSTLEEARKAIRSIMKRAGKVMHSYKCSRCGSYHLTSFSRKQYKDFKNGKR